MNSNIKTIIFWAVLICVAVVLWAVVRTGHGRPEKQIAFTDFIKQVDDLRVLIIDVNTIDFASNPKHYKQIINIINQPYGKGITRITALNIV